MRTLNRSKLYKPLFFSNIVSVRSHCINVRQVSYKFCLTYFYGNCKQPFVKGKTIYMYTYLHIYHAKEFNISQLFSLLSQRVKPQRVKYSLYLARQILITTVIYWYEHNTLLLILKQCLIHLRNARLVLITRVITFDKLVMNFEVLNLVISTLHRKEL